MFLVIQPASGNPPIAGEPILDQYVKSTFPNAVAIEIRSFSFDVENPVTIGSATGGAGTGKLKLNPFVVTKAVDRLSSSLFTMEATGGHLGRMQLMLRKAGGTTPAKPYLQFGFDMVWVSKIEWSGSEGDDTPQETVTFAYGGLGIGYYPQKADGTLDAAVRATWSQVTNTEKLQADVYANF